MRDKLRRLPSSKKVKQAQGKKSQEQYIFFMNGNIFSSTQTICYWVKMEGNSILYIPALISKGETIKHRRVPTAAAE